MKRLPSQLPDMPLPDDQDVLVVEKKSEGKLKGTKFGDLKTAITSALQGLVNALQTDKIPYQNADKPVNLNNQDLKGVKDFEATTAKVEGDLTVEGEIQFKTHTGTATFTGADNKIVMTDIVTKLGLEKGDVIQFSGVSAQNEKMRTVESITDNNTIIVNYEHCGNRGDGSLKLANENVSCSVKRIAKYFNAPLGLGRAWVNMWSFRSVGVSYLNSTGREMIVIMPGHGGTQKILTAEDTEIMSLPSFSDSGGYLVYQTELTIPSNFKYQFNGIKTLHYSVVFELR